MVPIKYCILSQIVLRVFVKLKNTNLCSKAYNPYKEQTFSCSLVDTNRKKHPLEAQELKEEWSHNHTDFKASFFAFKSKLVPSTLWLEFNYKSCLAVFRLKFRPNSSLQADIFTGSLLCLYWLRFNWELLLKVGNEEITVPFNLSVYPFYITYWILFISLVLYLLVCIDFHPLI